MHVFLGHMLGMLPVLGVHAFEQPPQAPVGKAAVRVLTCKGKGVLATGYDATQGFVVLAGSQAVSAVTPSFTQMTGANELRADLLKNGVLVAEGDALRFRQDYVFTAPSAASDMVLGGFTNGRTSWKDAQGRTLKEVQAAEAEL